MLRVSSKSINIPSDVNVALNNNAIEVKGPKGTLSMPQSKLVKVEVVDLDGAKSVSCSLVKVDKKSAAMAGTTRALINNMVIGVSQGFQKQLNLVGVGYRVQLKGNVVNFSLGYSHPIDYKLADGLTAESPSNTVLIVKGIDKQLVGQAAAEMRALRPPEPYKGKGVKYSDEVIIRKETKKK